MRTLDVTPKTELLGDEELDALMEDPEVEEEEDAPPTPKYGPIHTFTIKKYSRWYQRVLEGTFTHRIATPRDLVKIGVQQSRLLSAGASEHLGATAWGYAKIIAELSVTLTDAPPWFREEGKPDKPIRVDQFEDQEILDMIYQEAMAHQAGFWEGSGLAPGNPAPGEESLG